MLQDSYTYAKDAVWGKWERWLLLLMSCVVFPLITGYIAKIYRGDQPAPKFEEGGLFIMGLKLIFAGLIYAIPVIVVLLVTIFYAMVNFMPYIIMENPAYIFNNVDKFVGVLLGIGFGLLVTVILAIIISLISTIALIRLAKEGKFSEAFNFGAVMDTIRAIGWGRYIVAMIIYWVISIIFFIVLELLNLIPIVGMAMYWLVYIIVLVPFILFSARYVTLVYECASPVIPEVPAELSE
ncbi:MAG: DUF4013 domain-containing protein [Methanomicrobiales archaeon]